MLTSFSLVADVINWFDYRRVCRCYAGIYVRRRICPSALVQQFNYEHLKLSELVVKSSALVGELIDVAVFLRGLLPQKKPLMMIQRYILTYKFTMTTHCSNSVKYVCKFRLA